MKFVFASVLALLALQVCSASDSTGRATATTTGLSEDEKNIVNAFLDLVNTVVDADDLETVTNKLASLKARIERKLNVRGQEYLDLLAETLTKVTIPEDTKNLLISKVNSLAPQSRSKRSPSPKKFKKMKKGKKGKKGKGKKGKMGKMKKGGCGK